MLQAIYMTTFRQNIRFRYVIYQNQRNRRNEKWKEKLEQVFFLWMGWDWMCIHKIFSTIVSLLSNKSVFFQCTNCDCVYALFIGNRKSSVFRCVIAQSGWYSSIQFLVHNFEQKKRKTKTGRFRKGIEKSWIGYLNPICSLCSLIFHIIHFAPLRL